MARPSEGVESLPAWPSVALPWVMLMPTLAGMKLWPWIAISLLCIVIVLLGLAAFFRFQMIEVQTPEGYRVGTLDRLSGRIALAPVAAPTPTPTPKPVYGPYDF
jgi:ATP/ADP translocase